MGILVSGLIEGTVAAARNGGVETLEDVRASGIGWPS